MERTEQSVQDILKEITADCVALRVVSPAYAGKQGELTSALQYIYQSVLLAERGEERAARTVRRIASDELRHLEVLATLVCRLGAPPLFAACPPYPVAYYSASCVNYAKSTCEMIEADICAERAAIGHYSRMICSLENTCVADVIQALLREEREHLRLLEELGRMY